jgi:hypothetical protein
VGDPELRLREYAAGAGLGEALLPPVPAGGAVVSLYRQVSSDPLLEDLERWGEGAPPRELFGAVGEVWAVALSPDGSVSQGGPVAGPAGMTIGEGGAALYGAIPEGAEAVEVEVEGERAPVRVGAGYYLAAVPAGAEIVVAFRDREGRVVAERRLAREHTGGPT